MNDADYVTRVGSVTCPYYMTWANMLKRCYNNAFKDKNPSYLNCKVVDEWFLFSNFKKWMVTQSWEGLHLDKDILHKGNKTYGPEFCRFVTRKANSLIIENRTNSGTLPAGVTFYKNGRYKSQISVDGRNVSLGIFNNTNDAHVAYIKAKIAQIIRHKVDIDDDVVYDCLIKRYEYTLTELDLLIKNWRNL